MRTSAPSIIRRYGLWAYVKYLYNGIGNLCLKIPPIRLIPALWVSLIFSPWVGKLINPSGVIDHKSNWILRKSVRLLNSLRTDTCYIWKFAQLYIRDPHSHPMRKFYLYSKWHPFMLRRPTKCLIDLILASTVIALIAWLLIVLGIVL